MGSNLGDGVGSNSIRRRDAGGAWPGQRLGSAARPGQVVGTAISRIMQGQATAHDAGCELDDKLMSLVAR